MKTEKPTNAAIASALEKLADRLAEREANPHRVQAYHTAAQSVRQAEQPLADLLQHEGLDALKRLPGVGDSLSSRIAGFIQTGRLQLLEQLHQAFSPEALFTRVPGIGRELAQRIHAELGIETLEDLELAAHDGRLNGVEGFGHRRVRALRDQLNTMLTRHAHRRARRYRPPTPMLAREAWASPSVEQLLSIDREYRVRSARRELRTIAPRRFNPMGAAWLPVLNAWRGPWRITALFSNTARAHELGKTNDWVVIYAEQGGLEQRFTVVTETRGALKGKRVVRGREGECHLYHEAKQAQAA